MTSADTSLVIASGNAGATFLLLLSIGIAVVAALGLLLPWPPSFGSAVMCAIVSIICVSAALYATHRRAVTFDFESRRVIERTQLLGVARQHVWRFDEFDTLITERKDIRVKRDNMNRDNSRLTDYRTESRFVLVLTGLNARLWLQVFPDPSGAAQLAADIAKRTGWIIRASER